MTPHVSSTLVSQALPRSSALILGGVGAQERLQCAGVAVGEGCRRSCVPAEGSGSGANGSLGTDGGVETRGWALGTDRGVGGRCLPLSMVLTVPGSKYLDFHLFVSNQPGPGLSTDAGAQGAAQLPGAGHKLCLSFSVTQERIFLTLSNYIFTVIFLTEMTVKVTGAGVGPCLCSVSGMWLEWAGNTARSTSSEQGSPESRPDTHYWPYSEHALHQNSFSEVALDSHHCMSNGILQFSPSPLSKALELVWGSWAQS